MSTENEQAAPPAKQDDQNSNGGAVATVTRPSPPKIKQLPRFKVLLHNDDVNDILDVVLAIRRLTPLTGEEAVQRTLEAHHSGLALLLVTHQERAELYVEQFATFKLTVTTEPDA